MEFGTQFSSGKELRQTPAIITDKNGSLRLEMARDHPMLVQHSRFHTQGWRANGDVSLFLSKSDPDNHLLMKYLQWRNMYLVMLVKATSPLVLL